MFGALMMMRWFDEWLTMNARELDRKRVGEKKGFTNPAGMPFLDYCKDSNRDTNSFQVLYTSSRIENKPCYTDKPHSGLFSEYKKFPTETTIDLDTRCRNIE